MAGTASETAGAEQGPDVFRNSPPEDRTQGGRLPSPRSLLIPTGETTQIHTAAVAVVLVLDAMLILLLGPGLSAVASRGPPVYLLLPAAAAVYMSLASFSVVAAHRGRAGSDRAFVISSVSLAVSAVLAGLVATSGGTWGTVAGVPSSAWLYPACLAGITLPLASLWFGAETDPGTRRFGLVAALLPTLIALTALGPGLGPTAAVAVTSGTLLLCAGLFLVSGTFLGRVPPWRGPSPGLPAETSARPSRFHPFARFSRRYRQEGRSSSSDSLLASPRGGNLISPTSSRSTHRAGRWPDVVSTGFGWLDDLFLGGLPRRGQLALVGEAGTGSERVVWGALAEGLRRGESVVIITASSTVREIAEQMERFRTGFTNRDRDGRVLWVDASGRGSAAQVNPPAIQGPGDCVRILGALLSAAKEAERQSPGGFCVSFLGVSSVLDAVDDPMAQAFFRNLVGILRERHASVTFSIELTTRPVSALVPILQELDGTLVFGSVNGRTSVRVFGYGPVATRGWVECQFDHRGNYLRPHPTLLAGNRGRSPTPEVGASVP